MIFYLGSWRTDCRAARKISIKGRGGGDTRKKIIEIANVFK